MVRELRFGDSGKIAVSILAVSKAGTWYNFHDLVRAVIYLPWYKIPKVVISKVQPII
jgi:hypothetical protein